MNLQKLAALLVALLSLALSPGQVTADEIRVAVASNFSSAMKSIVRLFEARTQHRITLIFGSTGKHYAQIKNGAPYDVFFAADANRPELLDKEGISLPGSRFTYAIGKIVLWSPRKNYVTSSAKILQSGDFHHLAIGNPKLAPYGKAAQQVMQAKGVWNKLQPRLVRGENIGQAFQFVKSGNAELGFVAFSQVKRPDQPIEGSYWDVPENLYTPILQQAVLLKDKEPARAFLLFYQTEEVLKLIADYGYHTP